MDEEAPRKPKAAIVIGDVLDTVSVDELESRIVALEEEIRRVMTEIDKKRASKMAADSFFKS
jgi:uncharacterized small protein (DUF1192 family)